MAIVVAISNQKGGVGKTTTAINLSCAVAAKCRRVLLVDMDPQGNATSGLGIDKKQNSLSVYDALINGVPAKDVVIPSGFPSLWIMPAGVSLAGAEIEMVPLMAREQKLKNAIAPLLSEYDAIFIDCPPSLGLLTLNALTAANRVLVPIQCEFFALEGLGQLMNTVRLVKQHLNPNLELDGVVCTMYDIRTNLSEQVIKEVRKFFGAKVYDVAVPRNVRLAEAPSYGRPIEVYDPSCAGAAGYRELARQFLERNEGTTLVKCPPPQE